MWVTLPPAARAVAKGHVLVYGMQPRWSVLMSMDPVIIEGPAEAWSLAPHV